MHGTWGTLGTTRSANYILVLYCFFLQFLWQYCARYCGDYTVITAMPNVVCSVCDVCGVSGQVGLGPDWRQCQWNGQWKANKKTFVLVVLMMMLMTLMTHSYARSHNEILTFSSLVVLGACSS